jgi:hypothetical protein
MLLKLLLFRKHIKSGTLMYVVLYLRFYHEFSERLKIMSEVGRQKTEAKKIKKHKIGYKNMNNFLYWKFFLLTPDS